MKNIFKKSYINFIVSLIYISPLFACQNVNTSPSEGESIFENEGEQESEPETESESESESEDSTPFNLLTPKLSLNEETGLVSWNKIDNAEYYRYYINAGEIKQTTSTNISLESGSTISVIAESTKENVYASEWSSPITYFAKEIIDNTITIAFANCELASVTLSKGSTYTPNNPPNRKGYYFDNFYLDPFYKTVLTSSHIFNENTILYANYLATDWVKESSYWLWASSHITSVKMSSEAGWNYIPLYYDENKSLEKNSNVFSTIVTVNNVTENDLASFIGTDGAVGNHPGRIYFKNGESDFTISSNGTYKIYLSPQYYWDNNGTKVNIHIEYLSSSSSSSVYNSHNIPSFVLEETSTLQTVEIKLSSDKQSVYWDKISNADEYQYIIDNKEVKTTTSNSVNLAQGSFISVRAISYSSLFLAGKWSKPFIRETPKEDECVYVYFYGSDKPSEKLNKGDYLSRPNNNPVKYGYEFVDWYTDLSYKNKFDFNKPILKNTVIYASFRYLTDIKYSLMESNKTTKICDLEISKNSEFNEFKCTFTSNSIDQQVYVLDNETGQYYGPYKVNYLGSVKLYFSKEHLWDINTENERNVYIAPNLVTYYFSNNKWWSKVNYYTWDINNNHEHSWPGVTMTYVTTNDYNEQIYSCTFESKYIYLIFNNGSEQTEDIYLENYTDNAFYLDKKVNGKWTVKSYHYGG